ncbi:MAG: hypothetical protein KGH61_05105 [Candidatus Micrarchaeota archaeon]|nr:hypothetical protein [Candidatus Micrarchaeota archaeon]
MVGVPTKAGKYEQKANGEWTEIPGFNDGRGNGESEVPKAVVTPEKNVAIFYSAARNGNGNGPVGNESTLFNNVGSAVPNGVYSILDGYSHKTPLVSNRQFDSVRNEKELMQHLMDPSLFGIASGRKPSGPCHFGHRLVIETISFFQNNGAYVFMPLADNEAELDHKIKEKKQYRYYVADNLLDWGASGLDLVAAHAYLQSEEMRVMNVAYAAARQLNLEAAIDIYGRSTVADEMNFLFASMSQVGDILLPQHPDFGRKHSFMLSGPDQDGNMKMTMELSTRMIESGDLRYVKSAPSSLYVKSVSDLSGKKESASETDTTIYLGPSRNRYEHGKKGKRLEQIDKLTLQMRKEDTRMKVEKFVEVDKKTVLEAIARRKPLFAEYASEKEIGIDRFIDITSEILTVHQKRREAVYEYAAHSALDEIKGNGEKSAYDYLVASAQNVIPGFDPDTSAIKPHFWNAPANAVIPADKKSASTPWYSLITSVRDLMI